jgi:SOS-response transcriptional repressor LexA
MTSLPLTLTQSAVLHFMRDHQVHFGSIPTRREISDNFHWKSENAAHAHLQCLVSKGYIELIAGRSRNARFTPLAWELLGRTDPRVAPPAGFIALPVVDPARVRRSAWGAV